MSDTLTPKLLGAVSRLRRAETENVRLSSNIVDELHAMQPEERHAALMDLIRDRSASHVFAAAPQTSVHKAAKRRSPPVAVPKEREERVLLLLRQGISASDIAKRLEIKKHQVEYIRSKSLKPKQRKK